MSLTAILIALVWGLMAGYLIIRFVDSLIALGVCLHGLYQGRWQRLKDKAHTARIKPGIILRLMGRISLFTLAFGLALRLGYGFTRQELGFEYGGTSLLLWGAAACTAALTRVPATLRRIRFIWRMSHEYDYAEKRRRTQMLRG